MARKTWQELEGIRAGRTSVKDQYDAEAWQAWGERECATHQDRTAAAELFRFAMKQLD